MKILKAMLNLLYPRRAGCAVCGNMLGCDRDDVCEVCRERLSETWIGTHRVRAKIGIDGAAFAYAYNGPAGVLTRRVKYGGARVLLEEMSRDLARAVLLLRLDRIDAVTSVPMHIKRLRKRDFNHAEFLARGVAERIGAPYEEMLMRTRNAPQQVRLSGSERMKNLRKGFIGTNVQKGTRVLLIDDVFTTGSTAKHCARALRAAGARKVYIATYALTGRRIRNG